MNATAKPLAAAARHLAMAGCLLAVTQTVLAQAMAVITPRLPPRNAGHGAVAPSQAPVQAGSLSGSLAPSVTPGVPQRAEVSACRAVPTPDRQTLMLVSGTAALARGHVPLGEFRAQQVVHSPDGRWAVAYTKLRGAAQFAAMTIDLERCAVQRVLELSGAGEDVRFDGDDAVLRLADGERRIALRDGRVR